MIKKAPESSKARYKRYKNARHEYDLVRSRLEDIYDYFSPRRASFDVSDKGKASDRSSGLTKTLYDSTPQEALIKYASNIQSAIMPTQRRWYSLEPSATIIKQYGKDSGIIAAYKKELQEVGEALFHVLSSSNIEQALNESFSDMGISTGVNFINEQASDSGTISYTSIPPNRVYFSEDPYNVRLQNFWTDRSMVVRNIKEVWHDAKLTQRLNSLLSGDPETPVTLVEGCIYYPHEKGSDKYFYYVQDSEEYKDIVTRWLPYCPYTGFRAYKRSGEVWGRGVADRMLPFAKLLNKLGEYGIKIIKFSAFPAVGVVNSSPGFNASTVRIEPGSVVNMPMPNALQKLDFSGNPQAMWMERKEIVEQLNTAFFTDPLGSVVDTQNRTATEMQIRQEAWLRTNAVSVGRIYQEAVEPIIHKTLIAMRRKGLISDPMLDGKPVKIGEQTGLYRINLESPLVGLQKKDDALAMDSFLQRMMQMYGANTMAILENEKIPNWYADKLNVPFDLIKDEDTIAKIIENVTQTLEKNKEQLAQQKLQEQAQQPQQAQPTQQSVLDNLRKLS